MRVGWEKCDLLMMEEVVLLSSRAVKLFFRIPVIGTCPV